MANEVGTASNLEDLFGKMVSFLTTNAALVTAGQTWQILRQRRDNIAATTSSLNQPTSVTGRRTYHTFRYDPRSVNYDSIDGPEGSFTASNFSAGVSHVTWQLRTAREVKTVRIRAPRYTPHLSDVMRNFRLQYSDDGSSWTTALTVSSNPVYTSGQTQDFAVPGTPGSHLHWRVLLDSAASASTTISWLSMLLLEADGTVANHFGSEAIFKGTGTTGTDEIFVGIRSEYDATAGWYNLFLNGYTGFDSSEQSWFRQPGALNDYGSVYVQAVPMVPCWDASMPYWFVASGRSFRFAVKVSTSYEGGYLGFILPYATPQQYPYPLAVGGSLVPLNLSRTLAWRYSYANWVHGVFPGPGIDGYASGEGKSAALYMRSPDGEWMYFGNRGSPSAQPESITGPTQSYSAPYTPGGGWRSVWPHCMNDQWNQNKYPYRECLGGGYLLQPCVLLQRAPYTAVFGELEGAYNISGYQNAAENTTVLGGKTYVVFQNAYRNTVHEFWALSMDP